MQQPRCLFQHAHGALSESCLYHVLQLTDGSELSALTRLLKLDLAGKKTPKYLRDQLVVSASLGAENFFKGEQVVVGVYIYRQI